MAKSQRIIMRFPRIHSRFQISDFRFLIAISQFDLQFNLKSAI